MVLAVTHVLVPIIVFEMLRDRFKGMRRMFSPKHTFLVGIAGLMPDMDMPVFTVLQRLGLVTGTAVGHRIFLHNVWIPLGFLLFAAMSAFAWPALRSRKNRKYKQGRSMSLAKVFLLLAAGWLFHITLDAVLTGEVMPFYPLSSYVVNWNLVGALTEATGVPMLTILVSMDALLLLGWLWHEQFTHRIKDYF